MHAKFHCVEGATLAGEHWYLMPFGTCPVKGREVNNNRWIQSQRQPEEINSSFVPILLLSVEFHKG